MYNFKFTRALGTTKPPFVTRFADRVRGRTSDSHSLISHDYLTGSYALGFDTSTKIAHQLAQIAFEELGMDYIARRNAMVSAVTQADIRRAAVRTFADGKMLVVAAGRPVGL